MNRIGRKELAPAAAKLFEEEVRELIPDIAGAELCDMVDDFVYYQTDSISRAEARELVERSCRRYVKSSQGPASRAA